MLLPWNKNSSLDGFSSQSSKKLSPQNEYASSLTYNFNPHDNRVRTDKNQFSKNVKKMFGTYWYRCQ